ncbi:hypothetical protein ACF0H5_002436 [Mactra antiquata]
MEGNNQTVTLRNEADSENGANPTDLNVMFQCDFCQFLCEEECEMLSHLKQDVHSSASSVYATSKGKVRCVIELSFLQCPDAFFKKVAIVCPKIGCFKLFTSARYCANHFANHRPENVNAYGLVDVEVTENILYPVKINVCDECGYETNTMPQLGRHYYVSGHQPYALRPECVMRYICAYCSTYCDFHKFNRAVIHIREHFKKAGPGDTVKVMILSLSEDIKIIKFQPYES